MGCRLHDVLRDGIGQRVKLDQLRDARPFERFPERVKAAQDERKKSATALILVFERPGVHASVQARSDHHRMSTRKRRESFGRLPRSASLSIPLRRLLH